MHDDRSIGHLLDDAEIVGDGQVGYAEPRPRVDEPVEYLALDGYVKR